MIETVKTVKIEVDDFTRAVSQAFDYNFDGTSAFKSWGKPNDLPKDFNIGVIVGASGSGKSTLLQEFGEEELIEWDNNKAIISHFENPNDGINILSAVGLSSIPAWVKPYNVLSTGEKFRADLARKLKDNAVVDEFTSVVDRSVAKATSVAISKYIKNNNIKNVVLATCHEDILEWLEPNWVFDTNTGQLYNGRCLRRPQINIEIFDCKYEVWGMFEKHHYLTSQMNKSAKRYLAVWENQIVGMFSIMPLPSGTLKNAWRGHRLVVLPDYQGMGIGVKLMDTVAQMQLDEGRRFYLKTAHVKVGEYMTKSSKWKPTSKNKVRRDEPLGKFVDGKWKIDTQKVCYSFEYIGNNN